MCVHGMIALTVILATGLGLSISKQLIKLMKGELVVTSRKGSGSCFSFTVPCEVAVPPAAPSDGDSTSELDSDSVRSSPARPHRDPLSQYAPSRGLTAATARSSSIDVPTSPQSDSGRELSAASGPSDAMSVRILIAEDDPINRKLLQRILQQPNYVVDAVENGQEAVDRFPHGDYSVVLMDLQVRS